MTDTPLIVASGLVKIYNIADLEVFALQGLDVEVARGEIVSLVGPSGSGKSTLLTMIGGLDTPSAGHLLVDGRDLAARSAHELTDYRRTTVGFLWQQTTRNLLPYLTGRTNLTQLRALSGGGRDRAWIAELLDAVEMTEHADRPVAQLSGGQQQRIALACALVNRPKILLGDEPTGEVDWRTAQRILALLRSLRERFGLTVVMVTHDERVAAAADRMVAIRDGRVSQERRNSENPSGGAQLVVDAAGRLQIPLDQRLLAQIGRRARIEVVAGGLLLRPGDDLPTTLAPETEATSADDWYQRVYGGRS